MEEINNRKDKIRKANVWKEEKNRRIVTVEFAIEETLNAHVVRKSSVKLFLWIATKSPHHKRREVTGMCAIRNRFLSADLHEKQREHIFLLKITPRRRLESEV
jgi:hypothetical protein